MSNFAVIQNNKVSNVIVAESKEIADKQKEIKDAIIDGINCINSV